jgi:hypothetical protein
MDESKRQAASERWRDLAGDVRIGFKNTRDKGLIEAEMRVPEWPEWVVSGLFALHEGRLVLVELRILPAEDRDPPGWGRGAKSTEEAFKRLVADSPRLKAMRPKPHIGEWSRDRARLSELELGAGLSAKMLKDIRTGPLFDGVQSFAGFITASSPAAPEVYEQMSESPNPGRHRRDDLHWAEWARRIHEKTASPTRSPIRGVAEDTGLKWTQVRDIAHECRSHGFLGDPIPGRGGGYMTEKAREVLKAAKRQKGKRR